MKYLRINADRRKRIRLFEAFKKSKMQLFDADKIRFSNGGFKFIKTK